MSIFPLCMLQLLSPGLSHFTPDQIQRKLSALYVSLIHITHISIFHVGHIMSVILKACLKDKICHFHCVVIIKLKKNGNDKVLAPIQAKKQNTLPIKVHILYSHVF